MRIHIALILLVTMGFSAATLADQAAEAPSELSEAEKAIIDATPENALMKVLSIFAQDEKKVLRMQSVPVNNVQDPYIRKLAQRMLSDSRRGGYSGLAAVQVGIPLRMMVVRRRDKDDAPYEIYFNPEIIEGSNPATHRESCLSMRGYYGFVKRPSVIKVTYLDAQGEQITETISGHAARTFQHEVDHLDGIMYFDRIEDESKLRKRENR